MRGGLALAALLVAAVALFGGLGFAIAGIVVTEDECVVTPPRDSTSPEIAAETVKLEVPSSAKLQVNFGTDRGAKDDAIPNDALVKVVSGSAPVQVDLPILPLERGDAAISELSASAQLFRSNLYRVVVCVDPQDAPPGNYTSFVHFPEGFDADPMAFNVTLKSRGAEVGGVLLAVLAAVVGVGIANHTAKQASWPRALLGATVVTTALYATTVLNDETFGKGTEWWAYFGFFLTALVAAAGGSTAAIATAPRGGDSDATTRPTPEPGE